MDRRRVLVGALALCVFAPPLARAQVTPIDTPQGFSGRETLITFEGQGIVGPPSVSSLDGVTFATGSTPYLDLALDPDPRPFGPQEPRTVGNPTSGAPVSLAFASPMTRLGFELRYNGCNQRAQVEFYRGQTPVGTAQTPLSPADPCVSPAGWVFAGFASATPFDRVLVRAPVPPYVRLDNIRFENAAPPSVVVTPLPNPSTFSAQARLITFEGADNRTSTMGGVSFSRGVNDVRCGMFTEPRPFGPQEPMGCDNDQPFDGTPVTIVLPSPATRIAFETAYNGCGETVTVAFLNGTAQIGTAQGPPSGSKPGNNCSPGNWVFVGFQVTAPFDRIRITGPVSGYVRVDNLRFE